jgi:hypothetical protein
MKSNNELEGINKALAFLIRREMEKDLSKVNYGMNYSRHDMTSTILDENRQIKIIMDKYKILLESLGEKL